MNTEPNPLEPDAASREAADLAVNDWYYRLNAAGTPLAEHFNYSGKPLSFPEVEIDQQLVFDYLCDDEEGNEVSRIAVIGNFEEMQKWYNAGRLGFISVGGWRIIKLPTDPEPVLTLRL